MEVAAGRNIRIRIDEVDRMARMMDVEDENMA